MSKRETELFDDYHRYMRARDKLGLSTNIVYLEDLLKKYQSLFTDQTLDPDKQNSPVRVLWSMAHLYVGELLEAKRPIAAMEFMRNLIKVYQQRLEFEERFTESRIVTQQMALYQLLKQYGEDPAERWELIKDLKSRVEQLSPDTWEDNAIRSLRDTRAQIMQYYAAEESQRYSDHRHHPKLISRLISTHEEVLQLTRGLDSTTADQARSRSLRAICSLKEEQGRDEDYQVYAQDLHKATLREFRAAKKEQNLHVLLAYDTLRSHITLCKAYARVDKWDQILEVATNGLQIGKEIGWDPETRAHVEMCQLLIHRSHAYLNTDQPRSSLEDAWDAVREADAIPWMEAPQNQDVQDEYPNEHNKYRWQNVTRLHLIDTLFDRQVIEPDEQFGLVQAQRALQLFTTESHASPEQERYAMQYRSKKVRALRRLERWPEALAECKVSLDKSVQLLSSSDTSLLSDAVGYIVKACEEASSCLEDMGKITLADQLLDEADSFEDYVDGDVPLESCLERGRELQKSFDRLCEEAFPTIQQIADEVKQIDAPIDAPTDAPASSSAISMFDGLRRLF